jgi:hypothetical protein
MCQKGKGRIIRAKSDRTFIFFDHLVDSKEDILVHLGQFHVSSLVNPSCCSEEFSEDIGSEARGTAPEKAGYVIPLKS